MDMNNEVTTVDLEDENEVRVGIDFDYDDGPLVSLCVNHFENPDEWGAQLLTPEQARRIADLIVGCADRAKNIGNYKYN